MNAILGLIIAITQKNSITFAKINKSSFKSYEFSKIESPPPSEAD